MNNSSTDRLTAHFDIASGDISRDKYHRSHSKSLSAEGDSIADVPSEKQQRHPMAPIDSWDR